MRIAWSYLRRHFNILFVIAIGLIGLGAFLFIRQVPKDLQWENSIGAIILGGGFTFLITTISAGRSILEENRKAANLDRKRDVYGPLHAELKELRETFASAQIGHTPYPHWIKIPGDNFYPYLSPMTHPINFSYWPTFKKDYRIDDFTPRARKLLDNVESAVVTYNEALNNAKKEAKDILRQYLSDKIKKEEQRQDYQEWQKTHNAQPTNPPQRWFEFIERTISTSTYEPLADTLAGSWINVLVWILPNRSDQAAKEIYETHIRNMGATDFVPLSWFVDLFNEVENEVKSLTSFQIAIDRQQTLFELLQKAEDMLQIGLDYIQQRYEGGTPPV